MSHVKCQRSGLSLLEVLIVIAILAILSTASVGVFRNFVKNVELESTAKQIVFDLKTMQAKAIAGEDALKWGIRFVNSTDDYYQTFSTATDYASGTVKDTVYLQSGITFSSPAEGFNTDIIFNRVNGTISANTSVTIQSADGSKTVNVTLVGNIY